MSWRGSRDVAIGGDTRVMTIAGAAASSRRRTRDWMIGGYELSRMAAWAAARRAIGTRYGEQLT